MVDVKPDEISAILKQQLSGFKSEAELEEVGTVLQVGDVAPGGVAHLVALMLRHAKLGGTLLEFDRVRASILGNLH